MAQLDEAISGAVLGVTGRWARQRRAEERHASAALRRREVFSRSRDTIKEAAFEVMQEAYDKVAAARSADQRGPGRVSAGRRLARLEASLPPREGVLHWLADVQRCGSLGAYVTGLLGRPSSEAPFLAVPARARAAARRAHADEPRPLVREAERRAAADAVFLLELVIELEMVAIGTLRTGGLRLAALRWERRARLIEGDLGRGPDRQGWAFWRAGVLELATHLARTEAARRALEGRYLDGRAALSPAALGAWGELHQGVAALVSSIPTLPGSRRRRRPDGDAIRVAAEQAAPDEAGILLDRVRARTLDLLGDHAGAALIVARALRRSA